MEADDEDDSIDSGGCEAECCSAHQDKPCQPKSCFAKSRKKQGNQQRTFQKTWFMEFKWLTYCTTRNVTFCFYCRKMNQQGCITYSKKSEDAFVSSGFSNWKKANKKFKEHEKSHCHPEACMKYEALKRPSVVSLVNTAVKEEQQRRRCMLLKQLSSLRFLLRQGLAVRGHCDLEGNLYQLMK